MAENRDETSLARQLTSLVSIKVPSPFGALSTFSKKPTDFEVSLIDIDTSTRTATDPFMIRNEEQLRDSICPRNSVSPLLITQSAMQTLLNRYGIGMEFQDLVHSFSRKPRVSDAGHGRITMHRRCNGAYDIQYLLPYVESSNAEGCTKHTNRWTGLVMVSKFTDETSHHQALDWLVQLSLLREKLLPLKPRLKVVHQVLGRLKEIDPIVNELSRPNPDREQTNDLLEFYLQRVNGHLQSVEALESRLQGTLNLVFPLDHRWDYLASPVTDRFYPYQLEVAVDLGTGIRLERSTNECSSWQAAAPTTVPP
ncbi:hypothetical protein BDW67DRAFT_181910 [Aspergillus spinulosporus]